ncbi:LacI family DNA-binding transcriptional regulator [Paracoccus sp. DMF-8]|uniref:LacI family DNA-binding transcriptional regulator n=1 Tax=Paracoccus sp. DMF-8 TaxID=3019445 RepID=UPI0023E7F004|nr:LacI family DNA-binding transcriptional regulator [Paracoccus sp. DMF-8]MDF3605807.1 LacI family DNA-binding transcriptional regulator [Paracoccus sp. DMF-8]
MRAHRAGQQFRIHRLKAAGVSVTTVSPTFSGRRHVDPETGARVQALARQMGYHPSSAARALRSGRTGTIALASSMPFTVAAGPSRARASLWK